jgi:hypothetical protein
MTQEKSIRILKGLGYSFYFDRMTVTWSLCYPNGRRAKLTCRSQRECWLYALEDFNPYASFEICFKEMVPMIEHLGFTLKIEKYFTDIFAVRISRFKLHSETFEAKDLDIRIAICDVYNSYLLSEDEMTPKERQQKIEERDAAKYADNDSEKDRIAFNNFFQPGTGQAEAVTPYIRAQLKIAKVALELRLDGSAITHVLYGVNSPSQTHPEYRKFTALCRSEIEVVRKWNAK